MKKLICTLLTAGLLLTLAACAEESGKPTNPVTPNGGSQSEQQSPVQTQKQTETEPKAAPAVNNPQLENVYEFTFRNIAINVPNWKKIEQGYTDVFIINGKKYVALTCDDDSEGVAFADAHETAFAVFKQSIQASSYVNSLNVEKEETETINGIQVYRYEGTMNCGHDTIYDAYAVGYSFVMDGVACNVTGSVIDKDQPQEEIDAMRELVDAMIQTLRPQE